MASTSVLFLCLFVFVAIESRPQHVRHRHQRQLDPRFCENQMSGETIHHDVKCSTIRTKRSAEMSLETGQFSSLCRYRICKDIDDKRTPKHINRVFCEQQGCNCREEGSFKCTQLIERIEVWFGGVNGTMDVERGCVCAAKHSDNADKWTGPTTTVT